MESLPLSYSGIYLLEICCVIDRNTFSALIGGIITERKIYKWKSFNSYI